ncbi:glycosyltransferase family 4 protein [Candidatus Contubernalis alkaliaceticus]|uniref:glycosyltransferase family 4 protein n=1 Tax=Candidatus Contubernalis alkaliaceticus TaxID=338645 RepID=UPI001F4C0007|nr:glycosyltransferase family 4 protein [Candidatus Contubernalis alkalaceticus]UNC93596.1 glycosyltransferase family 4 protein [Candidatus Contubernalis alkalaceticus]
MKIAYFSPLPPQKSGISDYSLELLPSLGQHLKIDLFSDIDGASQEQLASTFTFFNTTDFLKHKMHAFYDHVLYHIGNNNTFHQNIYETAIKYPGIVVLHDYALHHMLAHQTVGRNDFKGYIAEMKYNYGLEGEQLARQSLEGERRRIWNTVSTLKYPLNKRILDCSRAVIVHSNFIKKLIHETHKSLPVIVAPLPTPDIGLILSAEKKLLRQRYNIGENQRVFSSFGFLSKDKRVDKVLAALKQIKKEADNFLYIIVGDRQEDFPIKEMVKEMGLQKHVKFTGFVNLDTFKDYIRLSDFCINLRYPTQGETSASLIRILGMGKPAIITNVGTFSDFPDTVTLKVSCGQNEVEDIGRALRLLLKDKGKRENMGRAAYEYVKENHHISKTVKSYLQLLWDIQGGRLYKNNIHAYGSFYAAVGDSLYSMGVREPDRNLIKKIAERLNEII